jgi:hypothetical protein
MKYLKQITLIICVAFSFPSMAQEVESMLNKRITLTVKEKTIKQILIHLSEKEHIGFSFSDDLPGLSKKTTLNVKGLPLREVLGQIFSDTNIEFKTVGQQIVLLPKKSKPRKHTINGFISDGKSGERLMYANIYDPLNGGSAISNTYGFYSITLPEGEVTVNYSYVGYKSTQKEIILVRDTFINESLTSDNQLAEVIITSKADKVNSTEMGVNYLSLREIKSLPNLFGESDIIKNIQLSPGVKVKSLPTFM